MANFDGMALADLQAQRAQLDNLIRQQTEEQNRAEQAAITVAFEANKAVLIDVVTASLTEPFSRAWAACKAKSLTITVNAENEFVVTPSVARVGTARTVKPAGESNGAAVDRAPARDLTAMYAAAVAQGLVPQDRLDAYDRASQNTGKSKNSKTWAIMNGVINRLVDSGAMAEVLKANSNGH